MHTYGKVKFSGEYQAGLFTTWIYKKTIQKEVIESMDNIVAIVLIQ